MGKISEKTRNDKIDIMKGFDAVDSDELIECFDTIKELTDFANMIEMANSITDR